MTHVVGGIPRRAYVQGAVPRGTRTPARADATQAITDGA